MLNLSIDDIVEAFKAHGGTIPVKNEAALKEYLRVEQNILVNNQLEHNKQKYQERLANQR